MAPPPMIRPKHNQVARDTLISWLNSAFRDGKDKIATIDDLADGIVLLDGLKAMDPEFVDYTGGHSNHTRSLMAVRNGLCSSFHRNYPSLEDHAIQLDIHAITEKHDMDELTECLILFMCLAVAGPKQRHYVSHMTDLGAEDPDAFKLMGRLASARMHSESKKESNEGAAAEEDTVMSDEDRVLSLEAALAKTHSDLDKTKKQHADTVTQLESLRMRQEEVTADAYKLKEENQFLKESETRGTADAQQIRDLKRMIEEQNTMIQSLEDKVQLLEDAHAKLVKEQTPLREKAEHTQNLEDEVQVLRYQKAELEKKSNAAENYKKKIMQQRDLQVEITGLKTINQELHDKMDEQEQFLRELPRLQEVESQFQKMLQSYETQISDLLDHKKGLEHCIRDSDRKLVLLEEQRSHDEKFIGEMRENHPEGVSAHQGSGLSLEQELEGGAGDDSSVPTSLEISRLKAENQVLRANMASASEAGQLRVELEAVENAKNRLQQKCNELFEDHTIAQERIKALMENMTGEGSVAFATMRRENVEAARDLSRTKKQLEDLQATLSDKDRDILSARTDCEKAYRLGRIQGARDANNMDSVAAVEKDSISALEELKTTDQLIAGSARSELALLQQRHIDLREQHSVQQDQLVKALLIKEKLAHDLEEAKDAQEKSQHKTDNEKMEKVRARAKHYKEHFEKSEQENYELQRKLKSLQDGDAAAEERAKKDQTIKDLLRENSMMMGAWYDIYRRLQSNHVVLQRRHDTPKSWVGKQRQIVNATPRR